MAESFGLHDEFSYEGFWWLPQNPEERLAGTLTFNQSDGAQLKLLGMFGGITVFGQMQTEYITIHGITKNGKPVTLLNAFSSNRQMNAPGIMNEQYKGHTLCIGHHFLSEDETLFSKSFFRFERLEEWLGANPFNQTWLFDPFRLNVFVDKGQSDDLTTFQGHTIGKSSDLTTGPTSLTDYSICVRSYLYCQTDEPRTLMWHFVAATRMQELASLCTGHYLPLTHLKVQVHDPDLAEGKRPPEVEVFAQMQHPQAGSRPKHETPLFSAAELLAANERAVENWFKQYETLAPAINLFFAVTGGKDMFVNIRFLLAIQALEVFHRRTSTATLMPKGEFKKLRKALVDAIPNGPPPEMTERLRDLYAFANEPSLMQRLTAMIEEVNADFGQVVAGFSGTFAKSVRDTRNYNTHFTSSLEPKALDGAGMYWASRRMVLLLTYLFLKKIGIKAEAFRAALERHREFEALFAKAGPPV